MCEMDLSIGRGQDRDHARMLQWSFIDLRVRFTIEAFHAERGRAFVDPEAVLSADPVARAIGRDGQRFGVFGKGEEGESFGLGFEVPYRDLTARFASAKERQESFVVQERQLGNGRDRVDQQALFRGAAIFPELQFHGVVLMRCHRECIPSWGEG